MNIYEAGEWVAEFDGNGNIAAFEPGSAPDPDIIVSTSRAVALGIINSDDPVSAIEKTQKYGLLRIKGGRIQEQGAISAYDMVRRIRDWLASPRTTSAEFDMNGDGVPDSLFEVEGKDRGS